MRSDHRDHREDEVCRPPTPGQAAGWLRRGLASMTRRTGQACLKTDCGLRRAHDTDVMSAARRLKRGPSAVPDRRAGGTGPAQILPYAGPEGAIGSVAQDQITGFIDIQADLGMKPRQSGRRLTALADEETSVAQFDPAAVRPEAARLFASWMRASTGSQGGLRSSPSGAQGWRQSSSEYARERSSRSHRPSDRTRAL